MKIMASGLITSWQIDGETMETVTDVIFLASKITEDGNCSHEIKRPLLLGRKAMDNLQNILKSRDITLPTKVCLVKAMVSPIVMYGCESWTIKKSWAQKDWCFWTMVLKRTLESPLDCMQIQPVNPKGNQCWIFIARNNADTKAPILASWCEEPTHWKRLWCWERLKAGREGNDRESDGWMASPTWWTWIGTNPRSLRSTGKPGMLQYMGSQRVRHE